MGWIFAAIFAFHVIIGTGAMVEQMREVQKEVAEASVEDLEEMQKVRMRF